ncbi:MAG: aminoglycoside phosphotransferase family protein [Actinomycetota bacterium]|nr:aminoglycoside phosphotransferase family protein [Actinomycetota bacterium]
MTLHDGEFRVDDALVAGLVASQMPEWTGLPLRRIHTSGTVNAAYRLGDHMLVRLPRHARFRSGPLKESRWLPELARSVPLEVPEYLALGQPTDDYPSPWSVLRWIDGEDATPSALSHLNTTAQRLGEFVVALRHVDTDGAPDESGRGKGLLPAHDRFLDYLGRFNNERERDKILRVWETSRASPVWRGSPTWFHGDLHSGNLLARDGSLIAVLDWEGCGVGDPASDLIAAWWLFDVDSRQAFRDAIQPDEAQWVRGMGWALYMAVAAIPYYSDSNPVFASMARLALDRILTET